MNSADNRRPAPRLAIVCPCYNEEEVLDSSLERLMSLLDELAESGRARDDSYVMVVNDGSHDRSWDILKQWHGREPARVKALKFARNAGHQNALIAGMFEAADDAQAIVTMDVDLQDDLNAIPKMLDCYMEGYEVVYGVKVSRTSDPLLKRVTAEAFYKVQQKMGIEIIFNHSDFRMLSSRVVHELELYDERNMYLRGIIPQMGYRSTTVDDVISARTAGYSKFNTSRMLRLALDGITSFSVKPLYRILTLGAIYLLIAFAIGIYVLVSLISGNAEHGWSSMMLSLWFIGGTLLLAIGMVGLYVGRIYVEVKHRPRYHVDEKLK